MVSTLTLHSEPLTDDPVVALSKRTTQASIACRSSAFILWDKKVSTFLKIGPLGTGRGIKG